MVSETADELTSHRLLLLVSDLGRLDVLKEVQPIGVHADLETVPMELVEGRLVDVISLDQLIAIKESLTRPQDKDVERDLKAIRALRDDASTPSG